MAGFEFRFSGPLAKKYGTNEAVILYNFAFWIKRNTANQRNIRDGRVWTYNSQRALSEIFDFLTERQIQRLLKKLEEAGAIIKGNYNAKQMDRTCWYAVGDEIMEFYGIPSPPVGMESEEMDRPANLVECIPPNGGMDTTESDNPFSETVSPIPDKNTDKNTDNNLSDHGSDGARVNQDAQFAQFWERYPRKEGRKRAREKWKRLNPDPALFAEIMAGLERHIRSEQWRRGVIPHPTTWLNGERWEDELTDNGPSGPNAAAGPDAPKRIDPGEGYRYV